MIATLSAYIEAGATSLANALFVGYRFQSLAEQPEQIMVVVGFAGLGLFAMRFILQWLTSEGQRKSVIPVAFWYFSIGGGSVYCYAIWRQDPVIICGQGQAYLSIYGYILLPDSSG